MFEKECIDCNKKFFSTWSGKKLCSNKCRYEWQKENKKCSDETKDRIKQGLSGLYGFRKGKTYEDLYGKEKSDRIKEKLRISQNKVDRMGAKNCFFGKTHTNDVRKIISHTQSKLWKERWQNKDFREKNIKKILNALLSKPSSFEKKFIDYFKTKNLDFEYVGDGNFFINGLNPDFICRDRKIVLEVFYSWFKIRNYGSVKNYIDSWTKRYKEDGWNPIFISEDVVKDKNFDLQVESLIKPYLLQKKL